MYCPKCGKLNKEGARFCAFCGEELFPEKIKLTKKTGIIGLIIFGFVLLLILNPFGYNSVKNSPSATVKNFYEALEKGEYSKVKGYVSSQVLLQEPLTIEDFNKMREEMMSLGGIKKIEITKENIEGETAEVCYSLNYRNYGNGETDSNCFYLIKEGGVWKIAE